MNMRFQEKLSLFVWVAFVLISCAAATAAESLNEPLLLGVSLICGIVSAAGFVYSRLSIASLYAGENSDEK